MSTFHLIFDKMKKMFYNSIIGGDYMGEKERIFNIPNSLCMFRILLIPVFLYTYFVLDTKNHFLISAIILMISGLSDFLDGFIARHFNMETYFGKIIDPIADKLTQFTVAIVLLNEYYLMWLLFGIILVKDGMLATFGLFLMKKGVKTSGASWWGKVATAYFDFIVVILIAFHIPDTTLAFWLIMTSSMLMFLAFVLYAKQLHEMNQDRIHNQL